VAKRSRKQQPVVVVDRRPRLSGQAWRLSSILIVAAIAIVYARSLAYPFTNFDDFDYIVDNRHVNTGLTLANIRWALAAMYAANWHPLTWISHQLDVSLFGVDAGKLRIVSILLHAASTILLLVFFVRTTGRKWASVAAAALFALHPLRVESVVWVSERKDTLSTFLFLATLLAYAAYARKLASSQWGAGAPLRYIFVFVLFVLGLSAKPMLITLPFVLLLLDYWPLKRGLHIMEKLPFFALTIPSAIITMHAQKEAIHPIAIGVRVANAVVSYVAYLGKIAMPASLAVMYPFRDQIGGAEVIVSAIVLIAITAIVIRFAKRFPYLLIGWLWYLGTLVPVIGIVQVGGQAMADRYTYIPSIGITIAVVWLIADLLRGRATLEIGIATAILAAILAGLTYAQVATWHDTITLFEHAVAVTPHNPQSLNALGREYLFRNQYDLAQEQFKAALAVDSHYDDAHDALGSTLSELGDAEGAEREFRAAIALNPRPVYFRDLGQLLATTGRIPEALAMYQKATGAQRDPEALAEIAAIKGDADNAIRYYREAIEERPRAPDLHNNLAAMLARKGLEDQAIVEYQTAVTIAPKQFDAHMNLGAILTRHKRNDEALREFRAAAEIRPNSPEPHVYLALLYAQTNHFEDAIAELRAAGQIDKAAANEELTTALGLQPKSTNLQDYIEELTRMKH
jgi:protein O-mannosyl-transferase